MSYLAWMRWSPQQNPRVVEFLWSPVAVSDNFQWRGLGVAGSFHKIVARLGAPSYPDRHRTGCKSQHDMGLLGPRLVWVLCADQIVLNQNLRDPGQTQEHVGQGWRVTHGAGCTPGRSGTGTALCHVAWLLAWSDGSRYLCWQSSTSVTPGGNGRSCHHPALSGHRNPPHSLLGDTKINDNPHDGILRPKNRHLVLLSAPLYPPELAVMGYKRPKQN